jgi:2-C-methyl-D-erythritol 4-phosphate cytidylyltransferase
MSGRFHIIVPAAGSGTRMAASLGNAAEQPKQYLTLAGKAILERTLEKLLALQPTNLCLVVSEHDEHWRSLPSTKHCTVTHGGLTRMDSVQAGLHALQLEDSDIVLVHDGVRPLFAPADVERLLVAAEQAPAGALLATPVIDTLKHSEQGNTVDRTENRLHYWLAQTPQAFRAGLLKQALEQAATLGTEVTDEASAVEALGLAPCIVAGSKNNIKITTAEDLSLAEFLLNKGQATCV